MHKIRDWLYIAGFQMASSKAMVQRTNITAMLQLFEEFKMDGVKSHFLKVEDGYPIYPNVFREGVDFVLNQHKHNRTILMTCGAGISRSVTFTIATLKELEGLTLEQAYRDIYSHHPDAMPDQVHWQSLCDYYKESTSFWGIWEDIVMGE